MQVNSAWPSLTGALSNPVASYQCLTVWADGNGNQSHTCSSKILNFLNPRQHENDKISLPSTFILPQFAASILTATYRCHKSFPLQTPGTQRTDFHGSHDHYNFMMFSSSLVFSCFVLLVNFSFFRSCGKLHWICVSFFSRHKMVLTHHTIRFTPLYFNGRHRQPMKIPNNIQQRKTER